MERSRTQAPTHEAERSFPRSPGRRHGLARPGPGASLERETAAGLRRLAGQGLAGAGTEPLPHLEPIQRSFGVFDVRGVRGHTDPAAAAASRALGATAFTMGDSVAFANRSPGLRTAAHEAAHAVQQRAGVDLPAGVGTPGDRYERHADAVADRVVHGQSAEPLLRSLPGPLGGAAGSALQMLTDEEFQQIFNLPEAERAERVGSLSEEDLADYIERENAQAGAVASAPARGSLKRGLERAADDMETPPTKRQQAPFAPGAASTTSTSFARLSSSSYAGSAPPAVAPRTSLTSLGVEALTAGKKDENSVYSLYSQFQQPQPLDQSQFDSYLARLAKIDEESRSAEVVSYPQREDTRSDRVTTAETVSSNPRKRERERILNDFYRAESKRKPDATQARISLRLAPGTATEVWRFISMELVGKNAYVKSAKIAGPQALNTRSDTLIIYLTTNVEEEAQLIAQALHHNFGESAFVSGVPSSMKTLAPGIGYAERHAEFSSHGESRAKAVELALEKLDVHTQRMKKAGVEPDQATLAHLLEKSFLPYALRQMGIDPKEPYKSEAQDIEDWPD